MAQTAVVPCVVGFTIDGGHAHQGLVFTFQPAGQCVHGATLTRPRRRQPDRGQIRCIKEYASTKRPVYLFNEKSRPYGRIP